MNIEEKARIKFELSQSEKMLPLTLDLIRAGTEREANIREFRDACDVAISLFQDRIERLSFGDLECDKEAAFDSLSKRLHTIIS